MKKKDITILLVDDEPDILEIIRYNLEAEGYRVKTADNGQKGVVLAKKLKPQLILLDVMMPKMDGMEACRQIREIPELDRKSTRLNSSHVRISYAVFCLKKKKKNNE